MKTAISLPDPLFKSGDQLARRLGVSRSELYARALAEFVAKHKASQYTERLNAVYDAEESHLDASTITAQAQALPRESW
jgi:metal-responsive CopG/Arc/MetJ family transcriptional regulator